MTCKQHQTELDRRRPILTILPGDKLCPRGPPTMWPPWQKVDGFDPHKGLIKRVELISLSVVYEKNKRSSSKSHIINDYNTLN